MGEGNDQRRAAIFWFTGLSGAGKSTVAAHLEAELGALGLSVLVLDGDVVRREMHRDLGFSPPEIVENNRLIAEYCARVRDRYDVVLVPIISPYRRSRSDARKRLAPGFYEIYFAASLDVVAARDVKGLYGRAASGQLEGLIGYAPDSPYEPPEAPDLVIDSGTEGVAESVSRLRYFILGHLDRASSPTTRQST